LYSTPLGLGGQRQQAGLEVLDVGLVEALVLAGEQDQLRPEVLLGEVRLQTRPRRIALADVDRRQIADLGWATQDVDAGAGELGPGLRVGEPRPGAHDRPPRPVGLLDDA